MDKILYSHYPRPYNLVYKEKINKMPFHMHNEIELVICNECRLDAAVGNRIYKIQGKNIIFLPSNCVHRITGDIGERQKRYILTISPTWLKSILGRDDKLMINSIEPRVVQISDDDFNMLEILLDKCIDSEILKRLSLLFAVLNECNRILSEERNVSELPIIGIITYINDNLANELKVKQIAEKFFYNPDYLCRIFKKYMNITLNEYINIQRISAAREMLDSGNDIKIVQAAAGFNSYSHFSRTFKKYIDMTPKQYKNKKYYFDTVN